MSTKTTTAEAAYVAACLPERLRSAAHLGSRVHFDDPDEQDDLVSVLHEAANKLEAADALLSLSAAYRAAHALYSEALATSEAAFAKRPIVSAKTWERLEGEFKAAESAMEAAKSALLTAALDIR